MFKVNFFAVSCLFLPMAALYKADNNVYADYRFADVAQW